MNDILALSLLILLGYISGRAMEFFELPAFRELKENFIFITIFQALVAFSIVTAGVYLFIRSLPVALILGAISSAIAPAAAFGVIEEYKAKGPLTSTLLAVVSVDDAIYFLLFGLVPQAGVAIGLIYVVKEKTPEIAAVLIAIVLNSTFINKIIGPIGVRIALLESKEGKGPSGNL